jgi:hypothetical protein
MAVVTYADFYYHRCCSGCFSCRFGNGFGTNLILGYYTTIGVISLFEAVAWFRTEFVREQVSCENVQDACSLNP